MDERRTDEPAGDPKFIPGIYNYCDQWCARCAFTVRCANYAMGQEELESPESQDIDQEAFWDKLHGILATTLEMVKERTRRTGIDFGAIDLQEAAKESERIREAAQELRCSRAAMKYNEMADDWFNENNDLLEDKSDELQTLARAGIPGTSAADEALSIGDCLEVIRWYQPQIWVKLCRAASGMIHSETEDNEYAAEDADGSAKVAILGIERSIAAWAALLPHLPDQEPSILNLLTTLKKLLQQVEASFPHARAFQRPGFDADEEQTPT
jgi:hypothetical protein